MATIRGSTTNDSTLTTLTLSLPVGAAEGDIAVVVLTSDDVVTFGAPSVDWTQVALSSGTQHSSCAYWRTLPASPPASYDFTSSISGVRGTLTAINPNGDTFVGITSNLAEANSATSTTTAITAVGAPGVLICSFTNDSAWTITTAPSGMTLEGSDLTGAYGIATYSEVDPADTPTITRSLVWSGADFAHAINVLAEFSVGGGGSSIIPHVQHYARLRRG